VVEAGVEVARQLLRPGDALAVVTSRAGGATAAETASERVVLSPPPVGAPDAGDADVNSAPSSPALYAAGRASQRLPMAVLTTHSTASTAELLAGALRDGGPQATIVGEQTYGKGRTQRVMALRNGADEEDDGQGAATLLVSTMRFATPSGAAIDGVGLEPDVACSAPASGFEVFSGGGGAEGDESAEAEMRALFEGDACVRRAAEMLAGK
jgi:C-terminal processing protease CtpA/Prc